MIRSRVSEESENINNDNFKVTCKVRVGTQCFLARTMISV
jgi:hypothetical protein